MGSRLSRKADGFCAATLQRRHHGITAPPPYHRPSTPSTQLATDCHNVASIRATKFCTQHETATHRPCCGRWLYPTLFRHLSSVASHQTRRGHPVNQSIEYLFLIPYNSCCALESPTLQRDARIGLPIFPIYRIANPLGSESGAHISVSQKCRRNQLLTTT